MDEKEDITCDEVKWEDLFEKIKIEKGIIQVILSISLAPFFEKETEGKFYKVRLSDEWARTIEYDNEGKGTLFDNKENNDKDKIFSCVPEEREFEKSGYKLGEFRGIVYDEIFTPVYRLEREKLLKDKNGEFSFQKTILKDIFSKDGETTLGKMIVGDKNSKKEGPWEIKIKLTKDGLATIFLEKTLHNNKYIKDYADETSKLLKKPDFNTSVSIITKHAFSNYLNAIGIYVTYLFLSRSGAWQKVAEFAGTLKRNIVNKEEDYLKEPHNISYTAFKSFIKQPPPLRNYCITYFFYDLEGKIYSDYDKDIIKVKDHFDCPLDIYRCEIKEKGKCVIDYFGHSLLSLSHNSYIKYADAECSSRRRFSKKELEKFAKQNIAQRIGELCFVESESVILCAPKGAHIFVAKRKIPYDVFWRNIIKGFSLLIECKTLAQIIGRLLYECLWHHRYQENNQNINKAKRLEEIQDILNVVNHLLSRIRLIATSTNLARAAYIREKFDRFVEVLGLPALINNIEKDYEEINEAISASVESKRTKAINLLTFLLVPLTFVISTGTVVLILHEFHLTDILKELFKELKLWGTTELIIFSVIGIFISIMSIFIGHYFGRHMYNRLRSWIESIK